MMRQNGRTGLTLILCVFLLHSVDCTVNLASTVSSPPSRGFAGLALQGGGFRAHCSYSGLFGGLVSFVARERGLRTATLDSTKLLQHFDVVATNSGGTWFFSELAYSAKFRQLIEGIAKTPSSASAQFKQRWWDPFKRATHVDPSIFNPARDIAEWLVTKFLGQGDEDTLFALQYVLSTNSTWNELVKIMFESTSDITRHSTLAAPVGEWAKGKTWMVAHTLLLPSNLSKGYLFLKQVNLSTSDWYQTATYHIKSSGNVPLLAPAAFSMQLGGGPNSSAPFPYVANGTMKNIKGMEYRGVVFPFDRPYSYTEVDHEDLAGGVLTHNVGSLPIWGVASASSAFGGVAAVTGYLPNKLLAMFNHADITPFVSRAPGGKAFDVADTLITEMRGPFGVTNERIDELASDGLHGLIDGGYSDGTGLGTAVAAGAREVLLVLNSEVTSSPFYLEVLCRNGPKPADGLKPKELFPLFETNASTVETAWSSFQQLHLPNGTQFLKAFLAGTIELTTADNEFFGIQGGRQVKVHLIHLMIGLDIGFLEKYVNFGTLAQEIALTLVAEENKHLVNELLLPMFALAAGDAVGSFFI